MGINICHFFHPATYTYSYVVVDQATNQAAVIDPVLDFTPASGATATTSAEELMAYIQSQGLELKWILETHVHADHLTAAKTIKETVGGQTGIGARVTDVQGVFKSVFNLGDEFIPDGSQFDRLLADGDTLPLGESRIAVLSTPGHTPACVSYLIDDALFVGDTLFMPDYGTARCDFPGGDAATLFDSIDRLLALPAATRMFMCHDYGPTGREYQYMSTVGEQLENNIHVGGGVSKEEYVATRSARDAELSMPALILPSLQINIRAGDLPPAEDNGTSYLKLPLNAF